VNVYYNFVIQYHEFILVLTYVWLRWKNILEYVILSVCGAKNEGNFFVTCFWSDRSSWRKFLFCKSFGL